jgi:hypothetical protein
METVHKRDSLLQVKARPIVVPATNLQCVNCCTPVTTESTRVQRCGNPLCPEPQAPDGGEQFMLDAKTGVRFCRKCGMIISTTMLDEGEERRTFDDDRAEGRDNSRAGSVVDSRLGNLGFRTTMVSGQDVCSSYARRLRVTQSECDRAVGALDRVAGRTSSYHRDSIKSLFFRIVDDLVDWRPPVLDPKEGDILKSKFATVRDDSETLKGHEHMMAFIIRAVLQAYQDRVRNPPPPLQKCARCGATLGRGVSGRMHLRSCGVSGAADRAAEGAARKRARAMDAATDQEEVLASVMQDV